MKNKIFIIFILLFFGITFTACKDRKTFPDTVTVFFYTENNSTSIKSSKINPIKNVIPGSKIQKPEDPVSDGLKFLGWYKDMNFTNEWKFDTDTVDKSMVIYAKWENIVFKINYVFVDGGGFAPNDVVVTEFLIVKTIPLKNPVKLGFSFKGWILTHPSEYKVGDKFIKTTEGFYQDLTVYALFEPGSYIVQYENNLKDVPNPLITTIKYQNVLVLKPIVDPSGVYEFVGWFSKNGIESGDWGVEYKNGDVFYGMAVVNPESGEITYTPQGIKLYAKWKLK